MSQGANVPGGRVSKGGRKRYGNENSFYFWHWVCIFFIFIIGNANFSFLHWECKFFFPLGMQFFFIFGIEKKMAQGGERPRGASGPGGRMSQGGERPRGANVRGGERPRGASVQGGRESRGASDPGGRVTVTPNTHGILYFQIKEKCSSVSQNDVRSWQRSHRRDTNLDEFFAKDTAYIC